MSIRKKRNILSLIGLIIILVLGPLAYFRFIKPRLTSAAWFDDKFYFRTAITITNSGSADANKKVKFDIDTATLYSAGKIQIDCDDSKFTDANGKLLQYYLDSTNGACNTNSTDYYVLVPTINAGTTTIYHYYGNPSATKGSQNAQFSQATFSQDATSTSTEEQSKAPVAYWSFDEGQGTIAYDATSNRNNGTLGAGTSAPTWQTEDMCVSGKCLYFGGNDFVSIGSTVRDVKSISFWVKPTTTTQNFIDLDSGTHYISDTSGVVSATGFGTPTIYVNGKSNGTLTANNWNHVEVTTATSFNATAIKLGRRTTNFLTGFLDEVKIYPYARSAAEIKSDYNAGKSSTPKGSSAQIGSGNPRESLSEGLVGYWKMEENTGTTVADSSGNGNTATLGTGTSAPTWSAGRFGVGTSFDGTSDYIQISDSTSLDSISDNNRITVSLWVKPNRDYTEEADNWYYFTTRWGTNRYPFQFGYSGWNDTVAFSIGGSDSYNTSCKEPDNTYLYNGIWYHYVGVYDGKNIILYKNGQQVAISPFTENLVTGSNVFMGGVPATRFFGGVFDEVRIYNRALTPAEVQQLYNWAPGPVAYYNFNEGVGSSAYDTSGNGNNGGWSGTGTHWTTGKYGKAGKFNGSDDFVSKSTITNMPTDNFTVCSWMNSTEYPVATSNVAVAIGDGTASRTFWAGTHQDTEQYMVSMGAVTVDLDLDVNSNTGWHYICGVKESTGLKGYVDGKYFGIDTDATQTLSSTKLTIGNYGTGTFYYEGKIDDVKIYNYARTQKQIVEDMNAGHPAGGSPIGSQVAYYKFDEGYGTTANNSGNGGATLNGTISGASWNNDGKFGKTLNFDGTDDVVTVTNATAIDLNGGLASGFSFSGWFNADSVGEGSSGQMFWKGNSTYLRVSGQSGANLNINASVDLATTDATKSLTAPITTNAWNHIVMAWTDDSDDELTIWVNGKNMGSSTNGDGAPAAESNNLLIGGTTTANFDGKIDDFKVYSYELTEDEIKIDYNRGSALQLGTKSSGTGNTAPATASSQEYCIPGDTAVCSPPVGRWDFNEGVGSSVFDTSGNGNNGGWNGTGTHWDKGKIGKAGKFNGTNDYVDCGNVLNIYPITIEAWIKITDSTVATKGIINKYVASSFNGYQIYISNGRLKPWYWVSVSSYTRQDGEADDGGLVNDGNWHHIVYTVDATGGKIYVDGAFKKGKSWTGTPGITTTTQNLRFGAYGTGYFNGLMDDVRIYNYARSPAQIAWDYNKGAPVGHWKLDECQGSTAHGLQQTADRSLDGTITIGPLGTQSQLGTCAIGTGSTVAWGNGSVGKYNASLKFDGTDDYVSVGTGFTAQSVSLWVKPTSNTSSLMQLSASANITASSGLISATGFSTPTIYVNGIASTTLSADVWQMVTATTATGIPAGAIKFGLVGSTYYSGQIDDVKIWNYALTPLQIKLLYNQNSAVRFDD